MRFHNINIRNILSEALNYGGIIVDVRTSEEFAKSHIPMAINLPLEEIQAGNISLPKGKVILVYCANGGGSTLAAKILTEKGYKVINTVGGNLRVSWGADKNPALAGFGKIYMCKM